jgi:hypothetical protein
LGLSGSAVAKKNINKDDLIYMNDVDPQNPKTPNK